VSAGRVGRLRAAPAGALRRAQLGLRAVPALAGAGLIAPVRPDRLARMLAALRLGTGPAALATAAAARHPDRAALVDEAGTVSCAELDRRAAAIACALRRDLGVGPGRAVALMCRNHRGFVEAMVATSRLGADLLLLNTDFPGPQLAGVLERERPAAAVLDEEFAGAFDEAGFDGPRVLGWHRDDRAEPTLDRLAADADARGPATRSEGRVVILTSGTTGTPKGAPRRPSTAALIGPLTTLLSRVPLRSGDPMFVAPPFFHGFGLAYLALGLFLGSPVVTRRRFEAEPTLAAIERERVRSLVAVPVMLQRILEVAPETRRRYDASSLRAVICGAGPLSGELSSAFMDAFGDIVHNLYGSTETGFGAIADPTDLRATPGTVGRPPLGTTLRILDADGGEAATGQTGRIFVGGELVFQGYSGGGSKDTAGGLMSTGDLGHLDSEGRLFIDGREDEMIVSGGENVFPQEVEEVLAGHEDVADVAVMGVEDERFGQALKAWVVKQAGSEPSPEALRAHVKANLARYKVPTEIVLVAELPRSPTGKVVRSRLEGD
jgi:acyl-CoA synthetase (AMP-forming)/AMP-acid ligase II